MKIIVGLGNPGKEYEKTRHNIGFDSIDLFCRKHNITLSKENFGGLFSVENINGEKVIIAKPMTFMNLSGDFIQKITHFYKIENKDVLVLHDDLDIEFGSLKIKFGGSSAGQNGIKDIINKLATENFLRVRLGIGNKQNKDAKAFVLGKFNSNEKEVVDKLLQKSISVIEDFITMERLPLMNKYNGN